MKILLPFYVFLLIVIDNTAQTFSPNFLGNDFMQYKGVLLKVKENAISGFTYSFYDDLKYCQTPFNNNVAYPDPKNKFTTVKDSLMNRIFIVESIVDKNGNLYSGTPTLLEKPLLMLKDTVTQKIIYYKYDNQYEHSFPFNTSKIVFDEEQICSKMEREVDDFTNNIKINSPLSINYEMLPMIIYKEINKSKVVYFLSLSTIGETLNVNRTGVIVLFDDGTKWTKSNKIDAKANKDGYEYSAFIQLTDADLLIFSTKKVSKYRLYIYDEEISEVFSSQFKLYAKCIKTAK